MTVNEIPKPILWILIFSYYNEECISEGRARTYKASQGRLMCFISHLPKDTIWYDKVPNRNQIVIAQSCNQNENTWLKEHYSHGKCIRPSFFWWIHIPWWRSGVSICSAIF